MRERGTTAGVLADSPSLKRQRGALFLSAYERARKPVAARAQRDSDRQARIYHLAGPLAAGRDAALRLLGPERMLARYDWLYGDATSR